MKRYSAIKENEAVTVFSLCAPQGIQEERKQFFIMLVVDFHFDSS